MSRKRFAMIWNAIVDEDSSAQIRSVWIAKEEPCTQLSTVHAGGCAHLTRHRLHLAARDQRRHRHRRTNARTGDYNRLVKQVKRAVCGFRNPHSGYRKNTRAASLL